MTPASGAGFQTSDRTQVSSSCPTRSNLDLAAAIGRACHVETRTPEGKVAQEGQDGSSPHAPSPPIELVFRDHDDDLLAVTGHDLRAFFERPVYDLAQAILRFL